MSNFQMTWRQKTPAVDAARRRVMERIEYLPDPMGGEGKLSPKLQLLRYRSHARFVASLTALSEGGQRESAA